MRQTAPLGPSLTHYYTGWSSIDGSWADVKHNEIRPSVPPTVKWTISSQARGEPAEVCSCLFELLSAESVDGFSVSS